MPDRAPYSRDERGYVAASCALAGVPLGGGMAEDPPAVPTGLDAALTREPEDAADA